MNNQNNIPFLKNPEVYIPLKKCTRLIYKGTKREIRCEKIIYKNEMCHYHYYKKWNECVHSKTFRKS